MVVKRVLLMMSASLVAAIMLFLLVIALNRPLDDISLLVLVILVIGAGVFTGVRMKRRLAS